MGSLNSAALKLEKRYLIYSLIGNVSVGAMGVVFAILTQSDAILLDGLFNLTYFVTGLFTLKVAILVAGGDDERFPFGYVFFEALVNGIKGVLMLGISLMAMYGAIDSLLSGGRPIAAGLAITYGIIASSICWAVAWLTKKGAEKTASPLLKADAENWLVNAAISSCVVISFAGIFLFIALGFGGAAMYVDPVVVLIVVLISLGVPVRMAYSALMALLNQAPHKSVRDQVSACVDSQLSGLPVVERFIRVTEPGRQRLVLVHIVLPTDHAVSSLTELDRIREQIHTALCQLHAGSVVDILFTADRRWGAALSDGGIAGLTQAE